jgi:hypothetical protein
MDAELARLIAQETPDLNPDLANGLAVKHIPDVEPYIDSIFRALQKGFPDGFSYVTSTRCGPQGDFDELTKKKNGSKRYYDVATSQLFMTMLVFKYRGEEIRRPLQLPYVEDAGVIYLGGSRFVISPVLSDRVMSVDLNSIFIRFNRGKVTFERSPQYFRANDVQETVDVVHGKIYNRPTKQTGTAKPTVKGNTTLVHYLFCKFGVHETFERFAGTVPVFGDAETVNHHTHPQDQWVICESSGIKPRGVGDKIWVPSPIRLAVRRDQYTATMKNYIAGLYYILDHFPRRVELNQFTDEKFRNHTGRWRVLMGYLIFGGNIMEGHLHDNVTDHIGSLDEYVDEIMRVKFREIKVPVEDIYQFFGILIERFNQWLLDGADKINSLYDKELGVLYYVMEDVTIMINTFYFKLIASAKSKREMGKDLKKDDIVDLMNKFLRPGKIYSVTKMHQEVSTTSCSGDNKAFKITSMMVPQAKTSRRAGRSDSGAMTDPAKILHTSVAEIGGYANMPKSDPSGHSRINLYAQIDRFGVVLQNPELVSILKPTEEMIRRKQ